jgi:two-component system response regulator FixJ
MTDAAGRLVFLASMSRQMRDRLAGVLVDRGVTLIPCPSDAEGRGSLPAERCDLLLVDLDGQAQRGLQLLAQWDRRLPQVPKLALVERGDVSMTVQAVRAGAADCLEKPVDTGRFLRAVGSLLRAIDAAPPGAEPLLTKTEATVLHLVLQGETSQEIAETLHRSRRTIEVHRRNIMRKLQVSDLADMVKKAASQGYLRSPAPGAAADRL